ncbi:hypothetical protein L227DRAFT_563357 [Lentinus tigrinus ALCF2SS1-6]|uniref:BTB domain-containing protein n=1 Tax=Lentinus tigrinus ALCF2SS1-6 TaxID=1328759 RepID=A0A5C2SCP9_9APHY|nr:hypothetical protein L227DRAFT_563357 [Lentinus tigrinus ALCF2SS1-6]
MSRKRPRYGDDNDGDSLPRSSPLGKPRTRDDDFWFEDGNIVLVAGDVEFRLYQVPLIRRSPVFRETLSMPQGDGISIAVPEVKLFDHPSDIRRLLGGIIFGSDLRFVKGDPDFTTLSSLIRMGHKYQVEDVVEAGLEYLRSFYPPRLAHDEGMPDGPPNFSKRDHIGVVNLARLTNSPDLLPVAFLHCCMLDPRELVKGIEREDGTTETLSPDDLATVLIAREELIKADALDCLYILDVNENCCSVEECRETLMEVLTSSIAVQEQRSFSADWREPWRPFLEKIGAVPCEACIEGIEVNEETRLEELCGRWPKIVGLE